MSSEPFIGAIKMFGFNYAPRGYAFCNGGILQIQQYSALYTLLGTTFGGNGSSTFGLPDLRSRAPVHFGQGSGLSNYALGQSSGTEGVTLNQGQLPAHVHALSVAGTLTANTTKGLSQFPDAGSFLARSVDEGTGGGVPQIYVPAGTAGDTVALAGVNVAGTTAPAGNSQSVPVVQPCLALNFCIATTGIFPSRD